MSKNYLHVTRVDVIPTWLEVYRGLGYSSSFSDSRNNYLASKVSTWCGDITRLEIDAIVNSTNRSLLGSGGRRDDNEFLHVDGAIHRAAGPELKKESSTLAPCKVGEAKITKGFLLPAKYVIHTVGPHGERPGKLKQCYEQSLALASEKGLRTIAFPCISTGVHGYPRRAAAKAALSAVKKFLEKNGDDIDRVVFCLFLDEDKGIYRELLQRYFSLE